SSFQAGRVTCKPPSPKFKISHPNHGAKTNWGALQVDNRVHDPCAPRSNIRRFTSGLNHHFNGGDPFPRWRLATDR
ncbi:hypothetical protein PIB30_115828, partial [Stylosanthes scabra]|nr:hypothetical protein [Stylosanthes scabra]